MTAESMRDLQFNTLIGMTDERGFAWHRRDDLRRLDDGTLAEDNHYPRFIPIADVHRRLFNWWPQQRAVAYLEPCDPEFADLILPALPASEDNPDPQPRPVRVIESQAGRHGLLRGDNEYDLGVFKTATHQPYQISLISEAERLTGTELGVSSAGLLAKGGKAWVEFSLPETLHDPKSGFAYRPNLVKADSMDGSMAKTTARTINATVCDNTLTWNLLEAGKAGVLFRRKHTAGFGDLQDERDALGILEAVADEFTAELHALIEQRVTKTQRDKVLDVLMPLPEDKARGTFIQKKRDLWVSLYDEDPMCAPWKGTAFGVVQTDNTFQHWFSQVNGDTSRSERNTLRVLRGKQAESDRKVVAALEAVLA